MNIFTITTTLISLVFTGLSTFAAFKGDVIPTFKQQNTLIINPIILGGDNRDDHTDISNDNKRFINNVLYYIIFGMFFVVLLFWGIYAWHTPMISSTLDYNNPYSVIINKLVSVVFFSLINSSKCASICICILASGLIFKNFRYKNCAFRLFHIISYSLLACVFMCYFYFLFKIGHSNNITINKFNYSSLTGNLILDLLFDLAPIFPFLQYCILYVIIIKLAHACLFGEYRSSKIRIDFRHIVERVSAPLIFLGFIIYICFLNIYI